MLELFHDIRSVDPKERGKPCLKEGSVEVFNGKAGTKDKLPRALAEAG